MRRFLVPQAVLDASREDSGGGSGAPPRKRQACISELSKVVVLPKSNMCAEQADLLELKQVLQDASRTAAAGSGGASIGSSGRGGSSEGASSSGRGAGSQAAEAAAAAAEAALVTALRQLSCFVLTPE